MYKNKQELYANGNQQIYQHYQVSRMESTMKHYQPEY